MAGPSHTGLHSVAMKIWCPLSPTGCSCTCVGCACACAREILCLSVHEYVCFPQWRWHYSPALPPGVPPFRPPSIRHFPALAAAFNIMSVRPPLRLYPLYLSQGTSITDNTMCRGVGAGALCSHLRSQSYHSNAGRTWSSESHGPRQLWRYALTLSISSKLRVRGGGGLWFCTLGWQCALLFQDSKKCCTFSKS